MYAGRRENMGEYGENNRRNDPEQRIQVAGKTWEKMVKQEEKRVFVSTPRLTEPYRHRTSTTSVLNEAVTPTAL